MSALPKAKEQALRALDGLTEEEANALFMQWWPQRLLGDPVNDKPFVALAGAHKARIRWRDATKKQVQASKRWLREHGYSTESATFIAQNGRTLQ